MRRPGGFDDSSSRPSRAREEDEESPRRSVPILPRLGRDSALIEEPSSALSPAPADASAADASLASTFESRFEGEQSTVAAVASLDGEGKPRRVSRARARLRHAERERRTRERRDARRFTAHRRSRRRVWLIVAASVLGLALFVAVGVFTPIMAVRDIQVRGAQAANPDELRSALAHLEGVPLALVNDADVHRVLEPFPLIQRYAIERIPPSTLVVRIDERSPVIALDRGGGEYELLDPAGVVLSRVTELPVGVPVGNAELNDTSSAAFRAASAVIRDMPEDLRAGMTAVRATNGQDVTFTFDTGTELIWGAPHETQRKAAVLRSLIAAVGLPALIDVSAPGAPVFR